MINKILMGIISLIITLVNTLLAPIDSLISTALPGLDDAFTLIGNLLSLLTDTIPWVMSWLGLNQIIRGLVVAYFTFILTIPIVVHTIKLAIRWYDKLKP